MRKGGRWDRGRDGGRGAGLAHAKAVMEAGASRRGMSKGSVGK